MLKRLLAFLPISIKRTTELHPLVDVLLEVQVSFSTHFQIWYRNACNEAINKEIMGTYFSTVFSIPEKENRIELLAFLHNPKQLEGQTITLSISARGEKIMTSIFEIESHSHHSGWHKISADILEPESIAHSFAKKQMEGTANV